MLIIKKIEKLLTSFFTDGILVKSLTSDGEICSLKTKQIKTCKTNNKI
jgi:hypothetical protein